jgi:acyl-CoA synthetase (AMP-forming)/AMP-acid ligase II
MTTATRSSEGDTAFSQNGLDVLLSTAARDCPDAILIRDDHEASTAARIATRVHALAQMLRSFGFAPGERILVVAGAQTAAFVAAVAVLRAGLQPALAPCDLGPIDLAAHIRASGAVALIGPSRYGALQLGETYLSAAAVADSIRMIANQGPDPVDGAIDVSFVALDTLPNLAAAGDAPVSDVEPPSIATFQGARSAPTMILHRQAALFADALSLVEQAHINPSKRLMSTLPLATLAGLVAGPFAALIGASCLVLHGPFESGAFLRHCDADVGGYHLVVPSAVGALFADKTLAAGLVSLVLVSRFSDPFGFALPQASGCDRPVVDVYAFGEDSVLAQRRIDGIARPPASIGDRSAAEHLASASDIMDDESGLGARLNRANRREGL